MNLQETNRLLVFIHSLDNRKPDDTVIPAWQLLLENDAFEDCEQAVIAHFRERPDVYLNAGHVHAGAQQARADRQRTAAHQRAAERAAARDARAIEAPATSPDEVAALKAALRAKLPPSDPAKLRPRQAAWDRASRNAVAAERGGTSTLGSVGLRLVVDQAPDDRQAEAS